MPTTLSTTIRRAARRVRRFLQLPAADQLLLVEALALLALFRIGLCTIPLRKLRRLIAAFDRSRKDVTEHDPALIERIGRAITAMHRFVPAASCLTQALSAQLMLARRGLASQLYIGVGKDAAGAFIAHAWVNVQGRIVVGGGVDLARFTALPPLEINRR